METVLTDHASQGVVERCRELLAQVYGSRFAGLVVYGSVARGDASPESDLDLLVLFQGEFDYFKELRRLTNLLYPVQLLSDRLLSVLPASVGDFETGALQLYRNAIEEGLRV